MLVYSAIPKQSVNTLNSFMLIKIFYNLATSFTPNYSARTSYGNSFHVYTLAVC